MDSIILQLIFASGMLYGLITIFIGMQKKSKIGKNQLGLAIALVVTCAATFLITIN